MVATEGDTASQLVRQQQLVPSSVIRMYLEGPSHLDCWLPNLKPTWPLVLLTSRKLMVRSKPRP
jgi:hypothetical protein